jgi:imidazole glycerol-phosphate synthase subunit HisH
MSGTKLSIIDYGVGNIGSVVNACKRAGIEPVVAQTGLELDEQKPGHILMPGVGAIGSALDKMRSREFEPVLNRLVMEERTPILGICVGMQMLVECAEEFGAHTGLGWLPGAYTQRIAEKGSGLRLPHIGWNTIEPEYDDSIVSGIESRDFYFVHSYAVFCADEFVLTLTEYGGRFVSAVRRGHVIGVQFHPEKSGTAGIQLLRNFMTVSSC